MESWCGVMVWGGGNGVLTLGSYFGVLALRSWYGVLVLGSWFGVVALGRWLWGGDFGVPPALSAVSPYRWVREFLNDANKGLDVLVNYLSFAQCAVM